MTDVRVRLTAALVDRYTIERELGAGGMATVYLAHDVKHDRKVAVKVLRPDLAAVLGAERFVQEIKTTASLQHPHILPLFDSGEADGFLYYVMPFIEGETLRDTLDRDTQLGIDEAVRVTTEVADALAYAHEHGVIHRDIKPENILLHNGRPMVADFGIALAVSAAAGGRMTETGLSLGTPHYMSPEQATAEKDVTPRSDIYSLGCVLYEMLAGEPPHTGATAQAIVMKIVMDAARPVTDLRRSVPRHIAAATAKALEKLPADRFETAAAFASALGDPGFAMPDATATVAGAAPPLTASARHRVRTATIAGGLLLVVVAAWGWLRPTPQPDGVTVRLALELGDVFPDPRNDIIVSPDGSTFALAGVTAEGGDLTLYVRRSDEATFRPVSGTAGARYPAFSPDGEWIVFTAGGALLRASVAGGAPLTILPAGASRFPLFPNWGDRGSIVYNDGDSLQAVPATGGVPTVVLADAGWAYYPRFLPGERAILLTDNRSRSVAVLDLETDSLRTLVAEGVDAVYSPSGHLVYAHPAGGLFAVDFDAGSLAVTGQPIPVLEDVRMFSGGGSPLRAHYALSATGTLVYGAGGSQTGADQLHLLIVAFDGDTTTVSLAPRNFSGPRWSPDGRLIAYASVSATGTDIYAYDVELGTSPRQLTFEGTNGNPAWSPAGDRVAFTSRRAGTDGADLFVKTVADDEPAQTVVSLPNNQVARHWPVDEALVFESGPVTRTELWITVPGSPDSALPYLQTEADLDDIVVSPDGAWAAYQSNETGTEEVYVRRFPAPRQQIPISDGGGQFPRWAPDGRTIYYWKAEDALVDTLVAAHVVTSPTFAVLSREPVLAGAYIPESWDLHPDGDRIIVAQRADPAGEAEQQSRYLVVVNWFDELRRRVTDH